MQKITKETPVGTDYKYEDAYIAIESEIDKTMSASSAGEVNWQFVQESSEEILSEQSKDLKIASYWLYAKWKLEGWRGLEEGIPILTQLLEVYQLTLFPKSDKVKRRILEWLHESLSEALMRDVVNVQEPEVKSLLTHLETLERALAKAFKEEDFALFSSLIRKLTKYLKEKEQREALDAEPTQEKKIDEQKPVEPIAQEVAVEVSSPHYSKQEHLQQIQQGLHGSEIQEELLLFEFTLSLAMQKMLKLLALEQPLTRTLFPTNEAFETLKEQKDEHYMTAVKSMLMSYPCWLEGYLNLFESLEASKSDEMMLELLKYKFIYFVEQHKTTIKTLSPDNYEVINHDLESFLELNKEERQSGKSSKQFEREYEHAVALFKKQEKAEAVEYLSTHYKNAKSAKEGFLWRLGQVKLAFEIDNKHMAVALLYELDKEIEKFNIHEWSPDLAIEVYVLLLKPSLNKLLPSEKRELFYGKLCQLSAVDAMGVNFL